MTFYQVHQITILNLALLKAVIIISSVSVVVFDDPDILSDIAHITKIIKYLQSNPLFLFYFNKLV